MFDDIINTINNKNFNQAIELLTPLIHSDDQQTVAYAYYYLGFINTSFYYEGRNKENAKIYLYHNLNSNYPIPYAYVLYANEIEDKNIAVNYLRKGNKLYPKYAPIYSSLLKYEMNKEQIIDQINKEGLTDRKLISDVIEYLISKNSWENISYFIQIIKSNNEIDDIDNTYYQMVEAYSFLFKSSPDYDRAIKLFLIAIERDINNHLAYSHYLGLIYSLIKTKKTEEAIKYFDRIPLNNSICDLEDGPWYPIYINFANIYKIIFDSINLSFKNDKPRIKAAKILYILYLYNPTEITYIFRYKKTDISVLESYLKTTFNKEIAFAAFNMRCHFRQYKEANALYFLIMLNWEDPKSNIDYSVITENSTTEEFISIIDDIIFKLKSDYLNDFAKSIFRNEVLDPIIKRLFAENNFLSITKITSFFSNTELINSSYLFECAYSYNKTQENKTRSQQLYLLLLKKQPNNFAALNNLGVIFENQGELDKALEYFRKALEITPSDTICNNNTQRLIKKLYEKNKKDLNKLSKCLTIETLNKIGYTDELTSKLSLIQDGNLKSMLSRDLKECAIAIAINQNKSSTIMCGSIIEALLIYKIKNIGKEKYDISEINKSSRANNFNIDDMNLNELIFVAEKETILGKDNSHLSHVIRNYRNIIHPAKEIRSEMEITQEKALMMWTMLKEIINEILV